MKLFNFLSNLSPSYVTVLQLCFLYGICVDGIEEFLKIFLPLPDCIFSGGQKFTVPTIYNVYKVLLSPLIQTFCQNFFDDSHGCMKHFPHLTFCLRDY